MRVADPNALHDVIYLPTGHVSLKAVSFAGAMSAAHAWNRNSPGSYRVYPTGTYEHPKEK